jgi:hypothetical protein
MICHLERRDVEAIRDAIERALNQRGSNAANRVYISPKNQRKYSCSVDSCERPAYATGLCNAHYIRVNRGGGLCPQVPLRTRASGPRICHECSDGTPVARNGGWGLCSKHYKRARRSVIKSVCVAAFGGHCSQCKEQVPDAAFDFHHLRGKDQAISKAIDNGSVAQLAEELAKCALLCANCHRVEHAH